LSPLSTADSARSAHSSTAASSFERAARAEVLRVADVAQEHHRQLALLDVALDVGLAGARGDVPVDRAHVVAGHVRAHLVELHAAALEDRQVRAGHHVRDLATGHELDALDLAGELSGKHGSGLVDDDARAHGTATFSRICATR
jgi:hypothetical protein